MTNYLKNVIIGCNMLANTPMGILRKRIQYVFDCNESSAGDKNKMQENKNSILDHIICINIISDNDIINQRDQILDIFNVSDTHHNIMFHSDSLSKTRTIICKILMNVFNVPFTDLNDIFKERHEHAIRTKDLDHECYQLANDEIEFLKPISHCELVAKLVLPTTPIIPVQTIDSALVNDLVKGLSEALSQQNESLEVLPQPQSQSQSQSRSQSHSQSTLRNTDYTYIMSILEGRVNPELVIEMLNVGLSTSDIINNLTF